MLKKSNIGKPKLGLFNNNYLIKKSKFKACCNQSGFIQIWASSTRIRLYYNLHRLVERLFILRILKLQYRNKPQFSPSKTPENKYAAAISPVSSLALFSEVILDAFLRLWRSERSFVRRDYWGFRVFG